MLSMQRAPEASSLTKHLAPAFMGLGLLAGLYASSFYNYLLFHSLVELFTVLTSFTIFLLAWHTRRIQSSQPLLFLGLASLFIAALELVHALAYKGMGVFPGYDANLPTQLWIALRWLTAASFLAAPFFSGRKVPVGRTVAACFAVTALLAAAIFSGRFPDCFVEGPGLTPFKVHSEYAISLLFLAAFALLARRRAAFDRVVFLHLAGGMLASIAAELSFTRYASVFGQANLLGHLFHFASVVLLYRAIVVTGVTEPFKLLFRDLALDTEFLRKTRDALEAQVRERTMALERAKRLADIGMLGATVAHELRNPLATIGIAAMNIRKKAPQPELARHLDNIAKKVAESNQIINNLLFYSRLKPPHYERTDLAALAAECLEHLREKCGPGLSATLEAAALDGVLVDADPVQLREVLENVLNNARDAVACAGKVRVTGARENGFVTLTVRDDGPGVEGDALAKAFEPFFTTKAKGTGLGLSVCRQIMYSHGGSIDLASSPGGGATVLIRLPERRPGGTPAA